jgi:RimJ/RimL family protein N-acetyltransferase
MILSAMISSAMLEFAPMPVRIDTARLVLTPEVGSDAVWLAELFNARGTRRFTPEDAGKRIAAMQSTTAELGIGVLVLRARGTGEPLGYCGVVMGRGSLSEPELAYELLPRAHGHGYATEAAAAVLDAAFATGRARIWATVRPENAPSFRVLEKLGFRRDHAEAEFVWMAREP